MPSYGKRLSGLQVTGEVHFRMPIFSVFIIAHSVYARAFLLQDCRTTRPSALLANCRRYRRRPPGLTHRMVHGPLGRVLPLETLGLLGQHGLSLDAVHSVRSGRVPVIAAGDDQGIMLLYSSKGRTMGSTAGRRLVNAWSGAATDACAPRRGRGWQPPRCSLLGRQRHQVTACGLLPSPRLGFVPTDPRLSILSIPISNAPPAALRIRSRLFIVITHTRVPM